MHGGESCVRIKWNYFAEIGGGSVSQKAQGKDKRSNKSRGTSFHTQMEVTKIAQRETQAANAKYQKAQDYNRHDYEDVSRMNQFKRQTFEEANGRKVSDPYNRHKLKETRAEAKESFGDRWQQHEANTDHKVALGDVHSRYKDSAFISQEELRELANADENLQMLSRDHNIQKSDSDGGAFSSSAKGKKVGIKDKERAASEYEKAKHDFDRKVKVTQARNAARAFHESGKAGAEAAATTAGIMLLAQNAADVVTGKKTPSEALKDTAVGTGKAVAAGYITTGVVTVISHATKQSAKKIGGAVGALTATAGTIKDFAQGKIDKEEFFVRLGNDGAQLLGSGYGAAVGQVLIPVPVLGAIIGSMVGTALGGSLYGELNEALAAKHLAAAEEKRIRVECEEAIEFLNEQRAAFEEITQALFAERARDITEGLSEFRAAAITDDVDSMHAGLNRICQSFGGDIGHDSFEEFDAMMRDDDMDFIL